MAKKLLVIGAGREQVPTLARAKERGLFVVAIDRNPEAPGRSHCDRFAAVDTGDHAGATELARELGIDGVLTVSSESAVPTVAAVAEALSLPGIDIRTAKLATDKLAMKAAFARHAVPTTSFCNAATLEQATQFARQARFPLVVKPAVSSGQRGMTFVDAPGQLENAFAAASGIGSGAGVVVEEYFSGPEANVTAVVEGGRASILSISHRVTAPPPHFGIAIAHDAPMALNSKQVALIEDAVQKAVEALEMRDGVVYPQIIVGDDAVSMVEIAARIPGGYMREVALALSGVDLVDVVISQALGEPEVLANVDRKPAYPAVVVRFLTERDKERVHGHPGDEQLAAARAVPGVIAVHWHLQPGDPLPALEHSGARFAAAIAAGDTRENTHASADKALELLLSRPST